MKMGLSVVLSTPRTQLRKPQRYQTFSNTYRYSRWKRPAKASSRITVNELEFSNLKTRKVLVETERSSHVVRPSLFLLLGADPWANEGSSQAKDIPLASQLSPHYEGDSEEGIPCWLNFLLSPILLHLFPHLGKYGSWGI